MRAGALAFAGLLIALVASAAPAASSDVCEQTIIADLTLTHDLVCSGNGLSIGASDVTLKLNGHSIIGPSRALPVSGVSVIGVSDIEIVGPGTITNFRTGILIQNSYDVEVSHVTIRENGAASPFFASTSGGIRVVTSHDIEIEESKIVANQDAGIKLVGSTGVEIEENKIQANGAGIYFSGAVSTGNTIEENKIVWNGIGIRGPIAGNTIEDNKFKYNGVDFAP